MLFRSRDLQAIMDGRVTTVFRRWKRPAARAGGNVRTQLGMVAIDSVEAIDPAVLTPADADAAGLPSLEDLHAALRTGEGTCFRITLRPGGADPREALRAALPAASEVAAIAARLRKLDGEAHWTLATLRLIGEQPGVVSTRLAAAVGQERMVFKANVRKLKALGLTISLEVGYQLSARGAAVLAHVGSARAETRE